MTIKWHGRRVNTAYRFYKVDWITKQVISEYDTITGGSLEWSAFTDTKADGSLDFVGDAPDPSQLVRVVMQFEDEHGETYEQALGTYIIAKPKPKLKPGRKEGSVDVSSVLTVLASRRSPFPFTIPTGTNAVEAAAQLVIDCGLAVSALQTSAYTTANDKTFDVSDSYLTIINWLLTSAGMSSANVDAFGNVLFTQYVDPGTRQAEWTLANDDTSIIYPEVEDEDNVSDKANCYEYTYSTDAECLWAEAINASSVDPSSTVNRKYRVDSQETVTELVGATQAERLAELEAMAKKKMLDNLSLIYYRTIRTAWVPVATGSAIAAVIDGDPWGGTITNIKLQLVPSQLTTIKSRRFVTVPADEITTRSGVIYG